MRFVVKIPDFLDLIDAPYDVYSHHAKTTNGVALMVSEIDPIDTPDNGGSNAVDWFIRRTHWRAEGRKRLATSPASTCFRTNRDRKQTTFK
jgi:hypothetical protein